MKITQLQIIQFKNHPQSIFQFAKPIVCFTGLNGAGKTNILDAIYFLCITKSYFSNADSQNIFQGFDFFRLQAKLDFTGLSSDVICKQPQFGKKEFSFHQTVYEKTSAHIGKMPVVMITPYDVELINDGSEIRRKFFDNIISQTDVIYLEKLIQYNKVLTQRNALLKQFAKEKKQNLLLLQTYDEQLISLAPYLFEKRKNVLPLFVKFCVENYQKLSGDKEQIELVYESDLLKQKFSIGLKQSLDKDLATQRTNCGIHKDDWSFLMNKNLLKKFGSQGQQKSFILSLKLAQWQFIADALQKNPFLLIDDFFDRLDENRALALMQLLPSACQIFISDTDKNRLEKLLRHANKDFEVFEIENGKILQRQV